MTFRKVLRGVCNYALFFLVVSFAVTCCMLLFVNTLANSMGLEFTQENISAAAKLTFGNVVLITLLFATIDYFRRRYLVDRPVKRITEATEKLMQGDFSVRLQPLRGVGEDDGFNRIIFAVNRMAQELSGMETLRADFVANVSHELKTPLAVMGNYAGLLSRPGLTEAQKLEYAQAISRTSRQLADLVSNILKLNRLENQQIFPNTVEYDLSEQLRESLLQYEAVWEEKEITVVPELEEQVLLRSDPELLGIVWSNLLSNALKFTPAGGTVGVRLEQEGELISVTVTDTGCGISPETGKHIFEKFYQGDTSHAASGNGLGLALVKRVIDILSGQIAVHSVPGEGSTFRVTLRRQP